jgi:hypothetical protein
MTITESSDYDQSINRLSERGCLWNEAWQGTDGLWHVTQSHVSHVESDTNATIIEAVSDDEEVGPFAAEAEAQSAAIELNRTLLAEDIKQPGYGVYAPSGDYEF